MILTLSLSFGVEVRVSWVDAANWSFLLKVKYALISAQRFMICQGNIARYREQANDTANYGKARRYCCLLFITPLPLCGFNLGPVESSGPPELRPVHTSCWCSDRPHALPLEGYSLSSKGYQVINWESVNTEIFFKNCFSVLVGT